MMSVPEFKGVEHGSVPVYLLGLWYYLVWGVSGILLMVGAAVGIGYVLNTHSVTRWIEKDQTTYQEQLNAVEGKCYAQAQAKNVAISPDLSPECNRYFRLLNNNQEPLP